jgi:hypothetical protein
MKQGIGFKINTNNLFVLQNAGCYYKVLNVGNVLMLDFDELLNRRFPIIDNNTKTSLPVTHANHDI